MFPIGNNHDELFTISALSRTYIIMYISIRLYIFSFLIVLVS